MKQQTLNRLILLKAEGQKVIYYINVKGLDVLFRPLTFEENNVILDLEEHVDGATINDTIVRMTTLYFEEDLETWLATCNGFLPDHFAEKVLRVSGFNSSDALLKTINEKREEASQLESLIECYICAAFHTLTPDLCKQMTLDEQLSLLSKAETIIGKKIDFDKVLNADPRDAAYPKQPGMESTNDLLDNKNADKVNWDDLR